MPCLRVAMWTTGFNQGHRYNCDANHWNLSSPPVTASLKAMTTSFLTALCWPHAPLGKVTRELLPVSDQMLRSSADPMDAITVAWVRSATAMSCLRGDIPQSSSLSSSFYILLTSSSCSLSLGRGDLSVSFQAAHSTAIPLSELWLAMSLSTNHWTLQRRLFDEGWGQHYSPGRWTMSSCDFIFL